MSRTLLQQWRDIAYDETADKGRLQRFWGTYFQIEKEIYEQLLTNPDEEVKGTVKELAEKYGQEVLCGGRDRAGDLRREPPAQETDYRSRSGSCVRRRGGRYSGSNGICVRVLHNSGYSHFPADDYGNRHCDCGSDYRRGGSDLRAGL